jgi:CheY-like chemotaxis protein
MKPHSHSVLLVEDHPDACEAFRLLIEAHGFDAVGARNGGEALGQLRAGLRCCLVVLDWWLPDMQGDEFMRHVRTEPAIPDVPVVVVTGDARVRAEALSLGAMHAFLKPLDPDALLALLDSHCPKASSGRDVA